MCKASVLLTHATKSLHAGLNRRVAWALSMSALLCLAVLPVPAMAYALWDISIDKSPCQIAAPGGTIDFPCQEIGVGFNVGAQDKTVTDVHFKFALDIKPFPQGQAQGKLLVMEKDPTGWDMQIFDAADTVTFSASGDNTGAQPGTNDNLFAVFLVTGADPSGPSGYGKPPFPYSFEMWLTHDGEELPATRTKVRVTGLSDSEIVPEPSIATLCLLGLAALAGTSSTRRKVPKLSGAGACTQRNQGFGPQSANPVLSTRQE